MIGRYLAITLLACAVCAAVSGCAASRSNSPPSLTVTIEGTDPQTSARIDPIDIWTSYTDRSQEPAAQVRHGERVKMIERSGDQVLVEKSNGTRGWLAWQFIREFR